MLRRTRWRRLGLLGRLGKGARSFPLSWCCIVFVMSEIRLIRHFSFSFFTVPFETVPRLSHSNDFARRGHNLRGRSPPPEDVSTPLASKTNLPKHAETAQEGRAALWRAAQPFRRPRQREIVLRRRARRRFSLGPRLALTRSHALALGARPLIRRNGPRLYNWQHGTGRASGRAGLLCLGAPSAPLHA